jgi:hypothetical protein
MTAQPTVTIKCLRLFGGVLSFIYNNPQQARGPWKRIEETGRAPDDSDRIITALYFLGSDTAYKRIWSDNKPL